MKVFLSALDTNIVPLERVDYVPFGLQSYYYLRKKPDAFKMAMEKCGEILIDSGAHSFQHGVGKKIDWVAYTKEYAQWIKENDNDKILGYFEMDIDNVVGYENVLELRKILLEVTDKIIPVWHKIEVLKNSKNVS